MDLFSRNNSLIYYNNLLVWFQKNKLLSFSLVNNRKSEIVLGDETSENNITSMNISANGTITVCNNNKFINVVKIGNSNFELIGRYFHPKRFNISIYRQNKNEIIIGDKFGDLYALNTNSISSMIEKGSNSVSSDSGSDLENVQENDLNNELIPKIGHLSTVTCSIVSHDSKFLFTGNKCGKIWVSNIDHLEHTLSILCGHSNSISSLCEVNINDSSQNLIVSSSLDRKIKLWDYLDGTEVDSINLEVSHTSISNNVNNYFDS